ncbi:hypothetical protein GH714_014706 [Hevea brasiliensis]|uniref:Large ribosomal subunit protein bL20c n=1 Tax=Hevea brasiliensis TaxID=3981 RepID=A0A6A6KBX4_HEVBR|nr:hypothetical protein GH714_014706 [Hevea brasiliensis]
MVLLERVEFLADNEWGSKRRTSVYSKGRVHVENVSEEVVVEKRVSEVFRSSEAVKSVNYGNFMHGLMKENIQLNRKVLSELSMHEPYSFKALVDISHNAFPGNKNVVLPPRKVNISINV